MSSLGLSQPCRYLYFVLCLLSLRCGTAAGARSTTANDQCSSRPQDHGAAWAGLSSARASDVKMAVLPLGSIEQHGPHLPLGTDLFLAEAMARGLAENFAARGARVSVLPSSPYGASFEHASFPGTVAVPDTALAMLWGSIVESVVRAGVRRVVLLNGHGGQTANAELASRNARFTIKPPPLVVVVNLQRMLHDCRDVVLQETGMTDDEWREEQAHGIHGGLVETAVMLHLHPSLVDMSKARKFSRRRESHGTHVEPHGAAVSYGWECHDLSKAGALGDASRATPRLGELIFQKACARVGDLAHELLDSSPDVVFDSRPGTP